MKEGIRLSYVGITGELSAGTLSQKTNGVMKKNG